MRGNGKGLTVFGAGLIVLALAGCSSSKSSGSTATTGGGQSGGGGVTVTTAAQSSGPTLVTVAGGERPDGRYYLSATPASVKAGRTTMTFNNVGSKVHEMVVLKTDAAPGSLKVGADRTVSEDTSVGEDSETAAGKTKSTTINLEPGRYILVCNIEGHYQKGMYTAFTVS